MDKNQLDIFPLLYIAQESYKVLPFVVEFLTALKVSLVKYFSDLDISKYVWINDPFNRNISFTEYSF